MSLDRLYILTGFVWLILGMVFGIYIGITDQPAQSNAHAHANLLGFVISALFGLMYRAWPNMKTSRLGMVQFGSYQVGVAALVIGKYQIAATGISAIIAPGSIVVVLGTLLMIWIFAAKSDQGPQVAPLGAKPVVFARLGMGCVKNPHNTKMANPLLFNPSRPLQA